MEIVLNGTDAPEVKIDAYDLVIAVEEPEGTENEYTLKDIEELIRTHLKTRKAIQEHCHASECDACPLRAGEILEPLCDMGTMPDIGRTYATEKKIKERKNGSRKSMD